MTAYPEDLQIEVRTGDDWYVLVSRHPMAAEWNVRYRASGAEWQVAGQIEPGTFIHPYYRIPPDAVAWQLASPFLLPDDAEFSIEHPSLGTVRLPMRS